LWSKPEKSAVLDNWVQTYEYGTETPLENLKINGPEECGNLHL
jgi:hypothetical protein